MISKTKVDHSFPDGQFFLDGFKTPFRLDRNRNSGDIMLFIRNDIPAKVFSTDDRSTESFYVELNFRKEKWLLICSNNPNPVDTGRKLNVHKTFRRRPGRLMYVQNTSCVYWEA